MPSNGKHARRPISKLERCPYSAPSQDPNGDEVYNVTVLYLFRDWRGEVKLNDEHTEWEWLAAREIPEGISPPIKPIIAQFKT